MKIAIIGAGMGGLAAASLLADLGADVTLFDRFDRPRPLGSGLVIQPVGQAVLQQLGALDHATRLGTPITRMLGQTTTGRTPLDVRYDLIDPSAFGLAIHRAALFDALWHAMERRADISVVTNAEITSAQQTPDAIHLQTALGADHGPFDLAIDASGAHSKLSPLTAKPLPFGALWTTVDWPSTPLPPMQLSQCYQAARHMIGVLPIGTLPRDTTPKATLFWSLPVDSYDHWRDTGLAAWKAQATTLWPAIAPFTDQITAPDQMILARYSHGTLRRPFQNRLIHIGDAAHRASPQLGQGANMALLDAAALAKALQTNPPHRVPNAYAKSRRRHTMLYQAMSWAFTPLYQSQSTLLPAIRDHMLAPASRIPPMPRLLTSLVCGTLTRVHLGQLFSGF